MGTIVDYAAVARDSFASRPLGRVDSLCLSWLAYLRFPADLDVHGATGVRIGELHDASLRSKLVASVYDVESSSRLVREMAASPRFADVRACLHLAESDEAEVRQFAATTFVLPDGGGTYVAFRGTDNTMVGWKENLHLVGSEPVPAQRSAAAYLNRVGPDAAGPLYVGGHSKGGNLAVYAAGMARDDVRARIERCFSHDGPGLNPALVNACGWRGDFPLDKTVPTESLVGMLFERSQADLAVVRCTGSGVRQHSPFAWQVVGNDFSYAQGMGYDAWRLGQRVNDWLERLGDDARDRLVDIGSWLMDATGESSFSGLVARWRGNARAMRAALDAAASDDRELFSEAMDDLATTLVLGSAQEYERPEAGTQALADAAARKVEDLTAKTNDLLSRLDRLTGR